MEQVFWICTMLGAGWLFWLAHRSNRRHRGMLHAQNFAQENEHLRQIVIQQAIERHIGRR